MQYKFPSYGSPVWKGAKCHLSTWYIPNVDKKNREMHSKAHCVMKKHTGGQFRLKQSSVILAHNSDFLICQM